jgi:transaldolase/glucose-6-phosphate isomerase
VRERIVAAASRRQVILVTAEKLVDTLGRRGRLPVEVLPFALPLCRRRLGDLELKPALRAAEDGPFVTDNFNVILDCAVGPIDDPARLERTIRAIPGVIDTGLFLRHRRYGRRRRRRFCSRARLPEIAVSGDTTFRLPDALEAAVRAELEQWRAGDKMKRLWSRDATLWTDADEASWLGWLAVAGEQRVRASALGDLANEIRRAGFTHALVLGMGGSSLCPKSSSRRSVASPDIPSSSSWTRPTRGRSTRSSTDRRGPDALHRFEQVRHHTRAEHLLLVFLRTRAANDRRRACRQSLHHDHRPGSRMEQVANTHRFRRIIPGVPSIGGRYSALSDFGMAPAAIMGLDVARFLARAAEMADRCGPAVRVADNPGALLGILLGVLARGAARQGHAGDVARHRRLGVWLEQLLAESTGKVGKGLIPVDGEPPGAPAVYGDDRHFVYVRLDSAADPAQDEAMAALERAGQPVVRLRVADPYHLGAEFFRWEVATAVAGAIIGVNPFDQPDVEASKAATRALTDHYENTARCRPTRPSA